MKHAAFLVISPEFRSLVTAMAHRLGPVRVVAAPGWQGFADQFDLRSTEAPVARSLIVGPPAAVLKHAAAETNEFGFVTPDAQFAKPWQRASTWRDDTTLRLWKLGWSPTSVDRLLVPTVDATIEYVIAAMRRTPSPTPTTTAEATCVT